MKMKPLKASPHLERLLDACEEVVCAYHGLPKGSELTPEQFEMAFQIQQLLQDHRGVMSPK